jgi:hypothetical protein
MSKMDGLRAMREAKYAAAQKAKPKTATARPAVAPAEAKAKPKAKAKAAPAEAPAASEELCGHRNMSGRTCTREAGHAAKSHRYS